MVVDVVGVGVAVGVEGLGRRSSAGSVMPAVWLAPVVDVVVHVKWSSGPGLTVIASGLLVL